MALTDNGHGDVCRYYSYDMHQMVPGSSVGNYGFLESLTEEERAVFEEGFEELDRVQQEEWGKAVEAAREKAEKEQKVTFLYPDREPFAAAVLPLHEMVLERNPALRPLYERIRKYNEMYASGQ